jgi:hypothetical protein
MKKYISYCSLLGLLALALTGCEKNDLRTSETFLPTDKAFMKFALFSPNTPSVMIKVNNVKINGANTSGNGGVYPITFTAPDYCVIDPVGQLKLSLANSGTGNDSVVIFTGNLALEAQKQYSGVLTDTGVNRTFFAIEDRVPLTGTDSGFVSLRVINAMPNAGPINVIRVDSASATVVVRDTIIRGLAYRAASDYIRLRASSTNAFLRFRTTTASGINLATGTTPPAFTTWNQRALTMYASGFLGGTGTLAPIFTGYIFNQ